MGLALFDCAKSKEPSEFELRVLDAAINCGALDHSILTEDLVPALRTDKRAIGAALHRLYTKGYGIRILHDKEYGKIGFKACRRRGVLP
jgi:hypothetical protein